MPTPCWLKHLCSIRALVPVSFFLSFSFSLFLSIYFWLIPWSMEAGCITQGILASLRLSLSHHRLQTTRFQSIKGPTAVKVLQSICQQIWKTQQWPQDRERSDIIPIPNKDNAKECSNYSTTVFISHANKVMLKILQARFQYMNQELPDVQAGSGKGQDTRNQITNICCIIEKAREFQKNIYFHFISLEERKATHSTILA